MKAQFYFDKIKELKNEVISEMEKLLNEHPSHCADFVLNDTDKAIVIDSMDEREIATADRVYFKDCRGTQKIVIEYSDDYNTTYDWAENIPIANLVLVLEIMQICEECFNEEEE